MMIYYPGLLLPVYLQMFFVYSSSRGVSAFIVYFSFYAVYLQLLLADSSCGVSAATAYSSFAVYLQLLFILLFMLYACSYCLFFFLHCICIYLFFFLRCTCSYCLFFFLRCICSYCLFLRCICSY